jgi:hypothetical protein
MEDWRYTSFRNYIDLDKYFIIDKEALLKQCGSIEEFKIFLELLLPAVDSK